MPLQRRLVVLLSCGCLLPSLACVAPRRARDSRFQVAASAARQQLKTLRALSKTPGLSVAVMHSGRLVFAEASGYADIEQNVEASVATRFGIGSITKALTCVAAVSLERDGILDLDAPLETYLPDFAHSGKNVTIRSILTHTSGLDDTFATEQYWTTKAFTIKEAAELIEHDALAFAPGTDFRYSTGSFTLVGAAMERAAGKPFEEIMTQRIFEPSGMNATVVNRPREMVAHRARFYLPSETGSVPEHAPTYDPTHKLPGAGYVSTATDIARFGDALLDGTLLDDVGMRRLFTEATTTDGKGTGYALGFQLDEDPEHGRVYHLPGGGPGISGWLLLYPKRRMTFVILSNMTSAPVGGREFGEVQDAFLRVAAEP